jgi:hypothetical protein
MSYGFVLEMLDRVSKPARTATVNMRLAQKAAMSLHGSVAAAGNSLSNMGGRLGGITSMISGGLAAAGIGMIGAKVIETTSNFERMEAVLTNTLGGQGMAQQVMRDITALAERTPFQVDALTDSWVRLANQGFKPNMEQMTMLGDLASSTGKDISMLSEAVIDAQVGEFERLKEFGIRAEKNGDRVKFSFKGQATEVAFTQGAIQDYVLSLGTLQGVQGSMAAQMNTTGGRISNMQDKLTSLYKEIADALRPAIVALLETLSRMLERLRGVVAWVQENRDAVVKWVAVIGTVVGAILGLVMVAKTVSFISGIVMVVVNAFGILVNILRVVRTAFILFNIIASANPLGLIVMAIAAVIAALVIMGVKWREIRDFLVNLGKFLWNNHPFKWMLDLIDRVFPQFRQAIAGLMQGVVDAFKKAFEWLSKNIFEPFQKLFKKLFDFDGSKFIAGKAEILAPEGDPYGVLGDKSKGGGAGGGGGTSKAMAAGLSDVRGGGGQINNITINIQKLNDGGITVQSSTLGMGISQVRAELERMLLSVVNDVNYS